MTEESFKHKLTAILSADVKEYSRLMSQDERGTIRTLTDYKEAMSTLIQEYKGRVVDSPGDNLLAEFGSVVDAVNCAVEIERELATGDTTEPSHRPALKGLIEALEPGLTATNEPKRVECGVPDYVVTRARTPVGY